MKFQFKPLSVLASIVLLTSPTSVVGLAQAQEVQSIEQANQLVNSEDITVNELQKLINVDKIEEVEVEKSASTENTDYRNKGCGKVSFYKPGERTASGGRAYIGSAAHKTLPFGTKLRVKFKNGTVRNVVIKDRGPYIVGRQLDIVAANPYKLGVQNACW
jgi:rare lipoprotein A (peptidoglycan hydrolase)